MAAESSGRTCGACTLCCKVLAVDELDKPMGAWCRHCAPGKGCGIYEERPAPCRSFACLWLSDSSVPDDLRPDRSKVVFDSDSGGRRLIARCDPGHPTAWRREPIYGQLKAWAREGEGRGELVVAVAGRRVWVIGPDEDLDLGDLEPGLAFSVERTPAGRLQVRFGSSPRPTVG